MADEIKQDFWTRIEDVTAGMLGTPEQPPVPMSHIARPGDNALWFITADGTGLAAAAAGGAPAQYVIADRGARVYARIEGALSAETDPAKIEELWSPVAEAWFEDGKKDDDIRLLRLTPAKAEVWLNDGSAKFLYEIAKANVTGGKPDIGDHAVLSF